MSWSVAIGQPDYSDKPMACALSLNDCDARIGEARLPEYMLNEGAVTEEAQRQLECAKKHAIQLAHTLGYARFFVFLAGHANAQAQEEVPGFANNGVTVSVTQLFPA